MRYFRIIPLTLLVAFTASIAFAQDDDNEALKLTAMEALMAAPPERALAIARRSWSTSSINSPTSVDTPSA